MVNEEKIKGEDKSIGRPLSQIKPKKIKEEFPKMNNIKKTLRLVFFIILEIIIFMIFFYFFYYFIF